jgi:transposase-like protein
VCAEDRGLIAVISDEELPLSVPLFATRNTEAIAAFLKDIIRSHGIHRGGAPQASAK